MKQELIRRFIRNILTEITISHNDFTDDEINYYLSEYIKNYYQEHRSSFNGYVPIETENNALQWKKFNSVIYVFFTIHDLVFIIFEQDENEKWNVISRKSVEISDKLDFDEMENVYVKHLVYYTLTLSTNEEDFQK